MGDTKFIGFGGEIINLRYVIAFYKASGKNDNHGKYAIIVKVDNYPNIYQWFDTEDERNNFFEELGKKFCE